MTRELGWPSREADALGAVAEVLIAQGRVREATPIIGQAERSHESALPYSECKILLLQARANGILGRSREAEQAARAATAIATRCGYLPLMHQAASLLAAQDGRTAAEVDADHDTR